MDTLLIAVTIVSLGVALVMGRVAWRASQEEKRRAAARVATLAAAAQTWPGQQVAAADAAREQAPSGASIGAPWRTPAMVEVTPNDLSASATGDRTFPAQSRGLGSPAAPDAVSLHAGFLGTEEPVRESSVHQRWLTAAAAVVAVLLGGFVLVRMGSHAQPAVAAQQESRPLELLSLRHERQGVNLSVAGLVRNPPSAPVVERVSAVVFLFDQQGQFVTSARAPIDFLKLTAGDESPFVVKVAAPQSVARYRVSFRTDEGTLPHVDRRGEPPVTAPVALTRQ